MVEMLVIQHHEIGHPFEGLMNSIHCEFQFCDQNLDMHGEAKKKKRSVSRTRAHKYVAAI